MDNSIAMQFSCLLIFTISGIAIGIFFDIFRVLRKSFKTPDFITYLEDILFWIITGIFLTFVLLKFNNGQIRSYVLIGLLFGIIIYALAISKYFIKINLFILKIIKKIISILLKIIFRIIKIIVKPVSFVVINIRKSLKVFLAKIHFFKNKKIK